MSLRSVPAAAFLFFFFFTLSLASVSAAGSKGFVCVGVALSGSEGARSLTCCPCGTAETGKSSRDTDSPRSTADADTGTDVLLGTSRGWSAMAGESGGGSRGEMAALKRARAPRRKRPKGAN